MHCQYDSSRTPPIHTDTLAHTRGCTLGQKWPQHWLWIVIPAFASMATPKETTTTQEAVDKVVVSGVWQSSDRLDSLVSIRNIYQAHGAV